MIVWTKVAWKTLYTFFTAGQEAKAHETWGSFRSATMTLTKFVDQTR